MWWLNADKTIPVNTEIIFSLKIKKKTMCVMIYLNVNSVKLGTLIYFYDVIKFYQQERGYN